MPEDGEATTTTGALADFWFGLGLIALGLGAAVESWRMPRLAELNVHPMTAPGLVPGLLGVVIFGLGSVLFVRAARAGGWRPGATEPDRQGVQVQVGRFFAALSLCLVYAAGMVGSIPFWAATFLFIFVFIGLFEWRPKRPVRGHVRALGTAALQAAIVSAAVSMIFEKIFLVRLP